MFNIYLWLYIALGIFVVAGGAMKLNNMGNMYGAIFFGIFAVALFILYGLRWFGASNSIFTSTPVTWPPFINTCPDYLTYYDRKKSDGSVQKTCIDLVGVSKNSILKLFPKDGDTPSDDTYYFDLATSASSQEGKNKEYCNRAVAAGLTWEGITNGESCVNSDGRTSGTGGSSETPDCPPKTPGPIAA
jgi:hypothetical protein